MDFWVTPKSASNVLASGPVIFWGTLRILNRSNRNIKDIHNGIGSSIILLL